MHKEKNIKQRKIPKKVPNFIRKIKSQKMLK